jgi:hypothetical protein
MAVNPFDPTFNFQFGSGGPGTLTGNTSGTYNFGSLLNNEKILREAWERCGKTPATMGLEQSQSLLRSMDLLFIEFANRGINLFAVYEDEIVLVPGVGDYTLPGFVARMLQVVVQGPLSTPNQQDLLITPISRAEWAALPNKLELQERPVEFYFERTDPPIMHFWGVPKNASYRILYWALRFSQDAGALINTPDAADRWLDAICAGVAARAARKYAPAMVDALKAEYIEAFGYAAGEDVEHVNFRYAPDFSCYYDG